MSSSRGGEDTEQDGKDDSAENEAPLDSLLASEPRPSGDNRSNVLQVGQCTWLWVIHGVFCWDSCACMVMVWTVASRLGTCPSLAAVGEGQAGMNRPLRHESLLATWRKDLAIKLLYFADC